jgi:hypothetical protein
VGTEKSHKNKPTTTPLSPPVEESNSNSGQQKSDNNNNESDKNGQRRQQKCGKKRRNNGQKGKLAKTEGRIWWINREKSVLADSYFSFFALVCSVALLTVCFLFEVTSDGDVVRVFGRSQGASLVDLFFLLIRLPLLFPLCLLSRSKELQFVAVK